jgi:hypothetical protein
LVEIGLTDWPKIGGAMAPLEPPGTTSLIRDFCKYVYDCQAKQTRVGLNPGTNNKQLFHFSNFQLFEKWNYFFISVISISTESTTKKICEMNQILTFIYFDFVH